MTDTHPAATEAATSRWLTLAGTLVAAPLFGALALLLTLEHAAGASGVGAVAAVAVAALVGAAGTAGWFARADGETVLRRSLLAGLAGVPVAGYATTLNTQGHSLPLVLWAALTLAVAAYLVGSAELVRTVAPQIGIDSANVRGSAVVAVVLHTAAALAGVAALGSAERTLAGSLPAGLLPDTVTVALVIAVLSATLAVLSGARAADAARHSRR
jgi:hypothetical protein